MTQPVAAELYAQLAPSMGWDDANNGWSLLYLTEALTAGAEEISELVVDTDDGAPGWSIIVDLDRAPDKWLDWLGQLKGARLISSLAPENKRLQIASSSGFDRGGEEALITRIQALLTGEKRVILRRRYNPITELADAWHLQIATYTADTPDAAKVEAFLALEDTIPAGIIVHYEVRDGQDWLQLRTNHPTWGDVKTTYSTWFDVTTDTP